MTLVRNTGIRVDKMIHFVDGVQKNGVVAWKSANHHIITRACRNQEHDSPSITRLLSEGGSVAEMHVKGAIRQLRDTSERAVQAMDTRGLELRDLERQLAEQWTRLQNEDALLNPRGRRKRDGDKLAGTVDIMAVRVGLKHAALVADTARVEVMHALSTAREHNELLEMARSLVQRASHSLAITSSGVERRSAPEYPDIGYADDPLAVAACQRRASLKASGGSPEEGAHRKIESRRPTISSPVRAFSLSSPTTPTTPMRPPVFGPGVKARKITTPKRRPKSRIASTCKTASSTRRHAGNDTHSTPIQAPAEPGESAEDHGYELEPVLSSEFHDEEESEEESEEEGGSGEESEEEDDEGADEAGGEDGENV